MILPYCSRDPLGYSIRRADGTILNLAMKAWEPYADLPSAAQLGAFALAAKSGPGAAEQLAAFDVPGLATPTAGPAPDDGRAWGPVDCDGSGSWASSAGCVTATRVFTWACRVRVSAASASAVGVVHTFVGESSRKSDTPVFMLCTTADGQGRPRAWWRDGAGVVAEAAGTAPIGDGSWHHLAATSDGVTLTLYADGASAGSTLAAGIGACPVDRVGLGGLWRGDITSRLTGSLRDARSYGRCLSSDEVAALARVPSPQVSVGDLWVAVWALDAAGKPARLIETVPLACLAAAAADGR